MLLCKNLNTIQDNIIKPQIAITKLQKLQTKGNLVLPILPTFSLPPNFLQQIISSVPTSMYLSKRYGLLFS